MQVFHADLHVQLKCIHEWPYVELPHNILNDKRLHLDCVISYRFEFYVCPLQVLLLETDFLDCTVVLFQMCWKISQTAGKRIAEAISVLSA